MSDEVKVFVLTWNLKSKGPKEDFRALLGLEGKSLPDIYAFGYQEAPILRPANLVAEEPWVGQMRRLLSEKNYVKLAHIRLQGIILAVYAQRQHITAISNLEVHYTRTGFGGLWGNKGGVSMRMNYRGCSLCFVNCHLAAHDHKLDQRISDYHSIMNNQTFYCSSTNNIVAHDYVILMGDLNFRINDFTAKEIHDRIKDNSETSRSQLLEKDQLTIVRKDKRAFVEFEETRPQFNPTYKFKANTDDYDMKKRKPAFTDRILYRCSKNDLAINQEHYRSHMQFKQSDHKPVTSVFNLKVRPHVVDKDKFMSSSWPFQLGQLVKMAGLDTGSPTVTEMPYRLDK
ncbi:Inositol polyphosphate 5-phosphatase K [Halotydeus destructor]|nr:Inositol polyphosphate 5-phosphatase K [Halotydeus destructor]